MKSKWVSGYSKVKCHQWEQLHIRAWLLIDKKTQCTALVNELPVFVTQKRETRQTCMTDLQRNWKEWKWILIHFGCVCSCECSNTSKVHFPYEVIIIIIKWQCISICYGLKANGECFEHIFWANFPWKLYEAMKWFSVDAITYLTNAFIMYSIRKWSMDIGFNCFGHLDKIHFVYAIHEH